MKAIYHGCLVTLTIACLVSAYPADNTVRTCICRLHGSDCPCCIASVSHPSEASRCLQKGHRHTDCGIEMPSAKGAPKLCGFCRCKEAKRLYTPSSVAVVIRSGTMVMFVESSKAICRKEGRILPEYRTPPMKPPPMVQLCSDL